MGKTRSLGKIVRQFDLQLLPLHWLLLTSLKRSHCKNVAKVEAILVAILVAERWENTWLALSHNHQGPAGGLTGSSTH